MLRHNFRSPKNKYGAKKTVVDGIKFDSQKEARYYQQLKIRQRAGEVVGFLRQVPIHLPCREGDTPVIMRIDFQEFHADGTVHFVDVKGQATQSWENKRKIAHAVYPWLEIETA